MKGQINHRGRHETGKDKSYKQYKQMSAWPTPTVLELFWLASVEHLELSWVCGTTYALETEKMRHREVKLEFSKSFRGARHAVLVQGLV